MSLTCRQVFCFALSTVQSDGYALPGAHNPMSPNKRETAFHAIARVIWLCARVRYWPGRDE